MRRGRRTLTWTCGFAFRRSRVDVGVEVEDPAVIVELNAHAIAVYQDRGFRICGDHVF